MPVNPFPILIPAGLVVFCLVRLWQGGNAAFMRAIGRSILIVGVIVSLFYLPGIYWRLRAATGDSGAMYEYARWCENYSDQINQVIVWPVEPDTESGYDWLERAAARQNPQAMFMLGVRLKYGDFVPRPTDWNGPAGNIFPQPERGQQLIDQAIALGFHAPMPVEEHQYYWRVFR